MAGRKPKPTHLKVLQGNPGCRPINENEPKPERMGKLAPPAHLSQLAKECWDDLAPKIDRMGLLTEADDKMLEMACELYAEIRALRADIAKLGRYQVVLTKTGDEMERARPAVSMLSDAERRFRGYATEFGLSPASRSRLTAQENREIDPSEAFFNEKASK